MNEDKLNTKVFKCLRDLEKVSILIYEVFLYNEEKKGIKDSKKSARELSLKWLKSPLPLLFGKTPEEAILNNQGNELINFLEAKLGIKHESL